MQQPDARRDDWLSSAPAGRPRPSHSCAALGQVAAAHQAAARAGVVEPEPSEVREHVAAALGRCGDALAALKEQSLRGAVLAVNYRARMQAVRRHRDAEINRLEQGARHPIPSV